MTTTEGGNAADLYIDLLKRSLTREISEQHFELVGFPTGLLPDWLRVRLESQPWKIVKRVDARRGLGWWPLEGETMAGIRRLDQLQDAIDTVLREGIEGDLIEAGVWRGGVTIFMRGMLEARGDRGRNVWVADSFDGLPRPDATRYPADATDSHWSRKQLAVSLDRVRDNFRRYGLLDERVRFVPGWFSESLASAPIEKLAIARIDGDMYGSTIEALRAVYPKVAHGGFVIIDDYHTVKGCRLAADDFRAASHVTAPLVPIDGEAVYWRRT